MIFCQRFVWSTIPFEVTWLFTLFSYIISMDFMTSGNGRFFYVLTENILFSSRLFAMLRVK